MLIRELCLLLTAGGGCSVLHAHTPIVQYINWLLLVVRTGALHRSLEEQRQGVRPDQGQEHIQLQAGRG